jgi:plastocyanin
VRSTIQDFQLKNLSVKAGTTVEWFNADADPHTATHGSPGAVGAMFRSPLLSQGGTYRHTFTVPGKFPYFCEIHTDMKAEVEVLP